MLWRGRAERRAALRRKRLVPERGRDVPERRPATPVVREFREDRSWLPAAPGRIPDYVFKPIPRWVLSPAKQMSRRDAEKPPLILRLRAALRRFAQGDRTFLPLLTNPRLRVRLP